MCTISGIVTIAGSTAVAVNGMPIMPWRPHRLASYDVVLGVTTGFVLCLAERRSYSQCFHRAVIGWYSGRVVALCNGLGG